MKFQAKGIIKFSDGLELKDPFMELDFVHYKYETNTLKLGCVFYETHNRHQRVFVNDKIIKDQVRTQDITDFLTTDDFLKQFTLIS